MKKIIVTSFLIFLTSIFNAQILDCPPLSASERLTYNSELQARRSGVEQTMVSSPADKYVFNVFFHVVRNNDGTGITASFSEPQFMNAIMILNTTFNPHNIYFKYRGFDYIDNTLYTKIRSSSDGSVAEQISSHPTFNDLLSYSVSGMTNPVYKQNAFNMYIVEGIDYNVTTDAIRTAGVAQYGSINSVYTSSQLQSSTLPHEVAHNFKIMHTWESWDNPTSYEKVDGSNALTAGDFIGDTKAAHAHVNINNDTNCNYINPTNVVDFSNTLYVNVPIKNFMARNNNCRVLASNLLPGNANFTVGQIVRARNHIATYYNDTSNTLGFFNAKTTMQSLYEPFAAIPILGTEVTITDDGIPNGMSNSCRQLGGYTYRWQKGFDYLFERYGEISNISVTTIPEFKDCGSFSINQLDVNYKKNFGIPCYRGAMFCQLVPMAGGKLYSTSNLVGGTFIEKDLTPLEIENPNLIETLPVQSYNILIKETTTGARSTETIYKQP